MNGEIPTEIGGISNLKSLLLSGNNLSGASGLETLRLSGNRLTGCVPESLRDALGDDTIELGLPFCQP